MFPYLKKLLLALNSNAHPGDIAHAVSCALLLAFVPKGNLLWPFLFFLMVFMRMNKGAFFLAFVLFSFAVPFADSVSEGLGYTILSVKAFHPAFAAMYDVPFVGLTRFNNTMVAGSLALGLIAYAPAYFLARSFVTFWRSKLQPIVVKSRIYKAFCGFPLVKLVINAGNLAGGDK